MLNYVRDLKFNQKPDYDLLREIFNDLYKRKGYKKTKKSGESCVFDW
jgi:hypothetical protein